jgi:anti-sigma regulatory factor (Ser/Thr protein kinase)
MTPVTVVPVFALEIPATPRAVGETRRGVGAFLREHDVDESLVERVLAAVSEAAGNVVRHAYPSRSGVVNTVADIDRDDDVQVVVADSGGGFRAGTSAGEGLGLQIIASVADDLTVRETASGGIEVWMRFVL